MFLDKGRENTKWLYICRTVSFTVDLCWVIKSNRSADQKVKNKFLSVWFFFGNVSSQFNIKMLFPVMNSVPKKWLHKNFIFMSVWFDYFSTEWYHGFHTLIFLICCVYLNSVCILKFCVKLKLSHSYLCCLGSIYL